MTLKHSLLAITLAVAALGMSSCTKAETTTQQQEEEEVYYIRYCAEEAVGTITYTDVSGTITVKANSSITNFERTVGPVQKGFTARFTITPEVFIPGREKSLRIECKKGLAPFVIKAEGAGGVGYVVE
jgi:hypothetical protein